MANSNNYLAPLGLAVIGAIFGIGHFGGLHETIFGSDDKSDQIIESNYDYSDSYSTEYGSKISFKGNDKTFVKTSYECNECSCSRYWGYKYSNSTSEGKCSNTDMWGHTCGHGSEEHGLRKW